MPIRGPGFPIYIALLHVFKLPLRLTSEILFILATAFFCCSLTRIKLPSVIILLVFLSLIFHPLTFYNFDMPMSETLFVILLLTTLGAFIRILLPESFRSQLIYCIVLGIATAFMIQTRPSDSVPIYTITAQIFICNYLITAFRETQILIWKPLMHGTITYLIIIFVSLFVCFANYVAYGVFSENQINDSAKLHLIHTLMRIDTGEAPIHSRIPVSTEARNIAYNLSPTLKNSKKLIEGKYLNSLNGNEYFTYGRTGVKGQLDMEDTLAMTSLLCTHDYASNTESDSRDVCDSLMNKVSAEISSALDAKKAKSRLVFSIVIPSFEIVKHSVGQSIQRILASFFHVPDEPVKDYYPFYGSLFSNLYDLMGNRNSKLVSKGPLEGFLAVPKDYKVSSMKFINGTDDFFQNRGPNYFPAYKRLKDANVEIYEDMGTAYFTSTYDQNSVPSPLKVIERDSQFNIIKFIVPVVHDRVFLHFMELIVTLNNGQQFTIKEIEQSILKESKVVSFGDISSPPIYAFITSFGLTLTPIQNFGYGVQKWIYKTFNSNAKNIGLALAIVIIATTIPLLIRRKWRTVNVALLCVLGILVSTVLCRVVYYAFVDAVLFPVNVDRHLFAASILFFPITIILCYFSISGLVLNRKKIC